MNLHNFFITFVSFEFLLVSSSWFLFDISQKLSASFFKQLISAICLLISSFLSLTVISSSLIFFFWSSKIWLNWSLKSLLFFFKSLGVHFSQFLCEIFLHFGQIPISDLVLKRIFYFDVVLSKISWGFDWWNFLKIRARK